MTPSLAVLHSAAQSADDAWIAAYQAICPRRVWPGDFRYTDAAKGAPGSELRARYDAFCATSSALCEAMSEARRA